MKPRLGPVLMGTLLTHDLAACVKAYETYLHVHVQYRAKIPSKQAAFWKQPHLAGCAYVILANALGEAFLRIIEDPDCAKVDTLKQTGWMALEIVVNDVDAIAASLDNSPFEVLRPVADLSLTDQIRAVQVRGPCGEVLYLSQIKGAVPPFDLPIARCAVDKIFAPIVCTHDRAKTLEFYEQLSGGSGLEFDAKITVINQAYGWNIDRKHPAASLQLKDSALIEIDQVDAAQIPNKRPSAGIMMLTFAIDKLPKGGLIKQYLIKDGTAQDLIVKDPHTGARNSIIVRGAASEIIELVEFKRE